MHIDWSAIGSWASFFASIVVGAFVYGRLTEKVAGHDNRILKLETDSQQHDREIVKIKAHVGLD